MVDEKLYEIDLYELLGINDDSSVPEVKKAYRKKALTCHPDKNPDNPKAAQLFHQLSKALAILIDSSARSAYDKVLNGRKAAKVRHNQLDSRRKKFKEELEERERKAQEAASKASKFTCFVPKTDEEKLQAEIERLRKEGSKQVDEEYEYVRQQVKLEQESGVGKVYDDGSTQHRLKIRWTADKDDVENGGYSYDILHRILSKYGSIVVLVISPKRKGSALVEFNSKEAAALARQLEKGLSVNPLIIEWLGGSQAGKPSSSGPRLSDLEQKEGGIFPSMDGNHRSSQPKSFPSFSFSPSIPVDTPEPLDREFENVVLRRMRQAEERKRLIEELEEDV